MAENVGAVGAVGGATQAKGAAQTGATGQAQQQTTQRADNGGQAQARNTSDNVQFSDELEDEGGPEGAQDDKKAEEAKKDEPNPEEEAKQRKLDELSKKIVELQDKLEAQKKSGDKEGAKATQGELADAYKEFQQLVDGAGQEGGPQPAPAQAAGAGGSVNPANFGGGGGGAPQGGGGAPGGGIPGGGFPGGGAPGGGAPGGGGPVGGPGGGGPAGGPGGGGDIGESRPANPNAEIPDFGKNPSKGEIGKMLDGASDKYGIPPNILKAVAWQESGWNPKALSFDGQHGKGVMQIDDRFHDFAKTPDVFDPKKNIDYGAKYLSNLYKETGSWSAALKRYNGGSSYPPKIMALSEQQPWQKYA